MELTVHNPVTVHLVRVPTMMVPALEDARMVTMDRTAPNHAQIIVVPVRRKQEIVLIVLRDIMDLLVFLAQKTVHLVNAHNTMVLVWETAFLATLVTSVIRTVLATVINRDVTNRVENVLIVIRDFMAVAVG